MADLFQRGKFHLASGQTSGFKIECDALTDADIDSLCWLLHSVLPPFGSVEGVPTGGLRIARAMQRYCTSGPLLIVDDVWTTGGSMRNYRGERDAIGAVLFARTIPDGWVTPLFTMRSA